MLLKENTDLWSSIGLLAAVCTLIGLLLSSKKVNNRNQK